MSNPKRIRLERRVKKLTKLYQERGVGQIKLEAAKRQLHAMEVK